MVSLEQQYRKFENESQQAPPVMYARPPEPPKAEPAYQQYGQHQYNAPDPSYGGQNNYQSPQKQQGYNGNQSGYQQQQQRGGQQNMNQYGNQQNYEGPPAAKRGRQEAIMGDHVIRLLIPSKVAGFVIGKGGMNVSRLRTDYSCQVQIPDSKAPERIVGINVEEPNIGPLVADVIELMQDRNNTTPNRELKMMVQQNQAGSVIGRGGAKIKGMREETGAQVHISAQCCPRSTDRVVTIAGTTEQVTACVLKVLETCRETPDRTGNVWYYNPAESYDPTMVKGYGGFMEDGSGGGGRGSSGGGFQGPPSGGPPQRPYQAPPQQQWGGQQQGPPQNYGEGGGGYRANSAPATAPWNNRGGGGGPQYGGPPGGYNDGPPPREGPIELRLLVPTAMSGRLIGKGGDVIGRLRANYHAQVQLPECSNPERVVSISAANMQGIVYDVAGILMNEDSSCEIRVLVHQGQAGSVIGRGGSRVSRIRQDTGASVKVYQDVFPDSSDRCIQVTGQPSQVASAILMILDDCAQTAPKGRVKLYDPATNYDAANADTCGTYIEGYVSTPSKLPQEQGGNMQPAAPGRQSRWSEPTAANVVAVTPPLRILLPAFGAAKLMANDNEALERLQTQYQATVDFPDTALPERVITVTGAGYMPGLVHDLTSILVTENSTTCEIRMLVHQNQAGSVIGRGGSRISKIRQDTSSEVKVYADVFPDSTDRCIQLSGQPDHVANAILMVLEDCAQTQPRGRVKHYDPEMNYDPGNTDSCGSYSEPVGFTELAQGGTTAGFVRGGTC